MNQVRTVVLLGFMTGLLVLLGDVLGGTGGAVLGLLFAAVANGFAWWASDRIVLATHRARLVGPEEAPELHALVARLARRADLPVPRVAVVPDRTPNAFATGRNPEHAVVAVTEGLLAILDPEELEGVLAHELAHVANRDTLISSVAATLAGAITLLARFGLWLGGGDRERQVHPLVAIAMVVLAPLAALLIQMAVSRSREFQADATGARIAGRARGLARALARLEEFARRGHTGRSDPAMAHLYIVNPLAGGGLGSLFRTHPSTQERIDRLVALDAQLLREGR